METIVRHLESRHVNMANYHIFINEQERIATFTLFNLMGTWCGYQQYRPDCTKLAKNNPRDGRYYTYCSKDQKAVFGLETFHRPGSLFLTEGLFDAVRLHNLGFAAVATLTNDPLHLKEWLRMLSRHTVAVCDPGVSGELLAEFGHEKVVCETSDLGAMTDDEVRHTMEDYL